MLRVAGSPTLRAASARVRVLLLPLLSLLVLACGELPVEPSPGIDFRTLLPVGSQFHQAYPFDLGEDFNDDGRPDRIWVVFYRFDLPQQEDSSVAPIGGAIYWLDSQRPAAVDKKDLFLPDGMYLCECDCQAHREDLVSRSDGEELLITDHCDERITRLVVYRWVGKPPYYEYVHHFSGDQITWTQNRITVESRLPSVLPLARSQLVERKVYVIEGQDGGGWRWVEGQKELSCLAGVPYEPDRSFYPEKVVLALYAHYTDTFKIRNYFTEAGWERAGGCWNSQCGCPMPREQVQYVRVEELQPAQPSQQSASPGETPPPVEGASSSLPGGVAVVIASIVCEPAGLEAKPVQVMWVLVQEGNHWLLNDVIVMPPQGQPPQQ